MSGRVLLVGPLPPPYGGISVHIVRLREWLAQRGWDAPVVAVGRTRPDGVPWIGNSPLAHLRRGFSGFHGIVHLHDRISVLTGLYAAGLVARGTPYVLTVHGVPLRMPSRKSGIDAFLRFALRRAACVIPVNTHVAEMVRPYAREMEVLPAYLPPSSAECADLHPDVAHWIDSTRDSGPIVSLAVYRPLAPIAHWVDVYGIGTLVATVEQLRARGIKFRLGLMLASAGNSPQENEFLSRHTERLRELLGPAFRLDIGRPAPPLVARSSLFLRPTTTDGDAVSVREALDLGVPVIASDCVPRPEGARVVPTGDAAALAGAIEAELARDRGDRRPPRIPHNGVAIEEIYRRVGVR